MAKRKVFFVQKEGVYFHGVYWIGASEEVGNEKLRSFAVADRDSYHEWALYEYIEQSPIASNYLGSDDNEHREVRRVKKSDYIQT